jgi:hypothetical protein
MWFGREFIPICEMLATNHFLAPPLQGGLGEYEMCHGLRQLGLQGKLGVDAVDY